MKPFKHAEDSLGWICGIFLSIGGLVLIGVVCLFFLMSSGCRSNDRGGFYGPSQYTSVAKDSVDPILAAFDHHYGLKFEWKWDKWDVHIREVAEVPGRATGQTHLPNRIEVEPDEVSVIPHEMVHVVGNLNGHPDRNGERHHREFKKMFDQFGW